MSDYPIYFYVKHPFTWYRIWVRASTISGAIAKAILYVQDRSDTKTFGFTTEKPDGYTVINGVPL